MGRSPAADVSAMDCGRSVRLAEATIAGRLPPDVPRFAMPLLCDTLADGSSVARPQTTNAFRVTRGLPEIVKYDNMHGMRTTRPVSWIKAARKDFQDFPQGARIDMARALTILAEGRMPDIAKPLPGFGAGVMELALRHRGDAFRVVYTLQLGDDIWVIHAFQKKSTSGIATPKREMDLVRERLIRLREALR